jgi:hypothetical protein
MLQKFVVILQYMLYDVSSACFRFRITHVLNKMSCVFLCLKNVLHLKMHKQKICFSLFGLNHGYNMP